MAAPRVRVRATHCSVARKRRKKKEWETRRSENLRHMQTRQRLGYSLPFIHIHSTGPYISRWVNSHQPEIQIYAIVLFSTRAQPNPLEPTLCEEFLACICFSFLLFLLVFFLRTLVKNMSLPVTNRNPPGVGDSVVLGRNVQTFQPFNIFPFSLIAHNACPANSKKRLAFFSHLYGKLVASG